MRKLAGFLTITLLLAGVFVGTRAYLESQNTAQRVVQTFVQNLESGNVEAAYERLAPERKAEGEAHWRTRMAQLKIKEGQSKLQSQTTLKDTFNAYPKDSELQRFVYTVRQGDTNNQLHIVIYKLQNTWVIGDFSVSG